MPPTRASYHPFLFVLMTCSAMAEIGLTAFLISAGNENRTWPSPRYHSLLIFFLFNAVWTLFFSAAYLLWIMGAGIQLLAGIASSAIWQLITSILWGAAAGIMHHTRTGGNCAGRPTIHRCRQSLTVEAIGWTELGLSLVTLLATCLWILSSGQRHTFEEVKDPRRLSTA
ncbi:hypothetical protein AX16_009632 [Volvariella volvacea WC 439]|nr:hypothetical protein AX16_009632 [Volvariella volvacea WC 439]